MSTPGFWICMTTNRQPPYDPRSKSIALASCTYAGIFNDTIFVNVSVYRTKQKETWESESKDASYYMKHTWREDEFIMQMKAAPLVQLLERSANMDAVAERIAEDVHSA